MLAARSGSQLVSTENLSVYRTYKRPCQACVLMEPDRQASMVGWRADRVESTAQRCQHATMGILPLRASRVRVLDRTVDVNGWRSMSEMSEL
jgi:hypothetical protein